MNNNAINFTLNDGAAPWNNSKGVARCFFTPGQWYHVVAVRSGNDVSNWKMYLNVASQTVTVNTNTLLNGDISSGTDENLKIGTRLNGHPSQLGYFDGTIKNVRLYSRALGASEVMVNYNDSCANAPSNTTGMVLWAKLESGSGTTVKDHSSYGETGSFTGTGLAWGRKIREDGCTDASTCFEQVSARYFAGGQLRGFNGMMRDDEIAGSGNSYTAEFWQYDPRTGRRWNLDPVIAPWESPYATFRNNPIIFTDPNGDCPKCPEGEKEDTHTDENGDMWIHDGKDWTVAPHGEVEHVGEGYEKVVIEKNTFLVNSQEVKIWDKGQNAFTDYNYMRKQPAGYAATGASAELPIVGGVGVEGGSIFIGNNFSHIEGFWEQKIKGSTSGLSYQIGTDADLPVDVTFFKVGFGNLILHQAPLTGSLVKFLNQGEVAFFLEGDAGIYGGWINVFDSKNVLLYSVKVVGLAMSMQGINGSIPFSAPRFEAVKFPETFEDSLERSNSQKGKSSLMRIWNENN